MAKSYSSAHCAIGFAIFLLMFTEPYLAFRFLSVWLPLWLEHGLVARKSSSDGINPVLAHKG